MGNKHSLGKDDYAAWLSSKASEIVCISIVNLKDAIGVRKKLALVEHYIFAKQNRAIFGKEKYL